MFSILRKTLLLVWRRTWRESKLTAQALIVLLLCVRAYFQGSLIIVYRLFLLRFRMCFVYDVFCRTRREKILWVRRTVHSVPQWFAKVFNRHKTLLRLYDTCCAKCFEISLALRKEIRLNEDYVCQVWNKVRERCELLEWFSSPLAREW